MTALITGAVGVALVGVGVMSMATSESERTSAAARAVVAATVPRAPEKVESKREDIDDGSWTDADLQLCKAEAKAAAKAANERRVQAISDGRVGLGAPAPEVVERSAYLLCSSTRKPKHLCKSYWRNQYIEAIKQYADDFRSVSAQAYWERHDILEQARQDGNVDPSFWQTVTDGQRATTHEMAEMHEKIVTAFRNRIKDGIVRPDDFGVFLGVGIPPDIARLIGGVRPLIDVCG